MKLKISLATLSVLLVCQMLQAAEPPKGSITIDRISEIKYPTGQQWSPDGKTIAFLWDWAGKQNLFMVKPGEKPVALTDFPVDPNTWRTDIGRFEWASADRIIFAREGGLWSVSTDGTRPSRMAGYEGVANFA